MTTRFVISNVKIDPYLAITFLDIYSSDITLSQAIRWVFTRK